MEPYQIAAGTRPEPPDHSNLPSPPNQGVEHQDLLMAVLRAIALRRHLPLAQSMLEIPQGLSQQDTIRHLQAVFTPQAMAALSMDLQAKKLRVTKYQSAVGFLMYFGLGPRPDIAYAVSVLGRNASNPTRATFPRHLRALKSTFNHIKGSGGTHTEAFSSHQQSGGNGGEGTL